MGENEFEHLNFFSKDAVVICRNVINVNVFAFENVVIVKTRISRKK